MMFDLKEALKNLPDKPGVYLMKDGYGHVIYVGKAKVLKNRVRQYFHKSANHTNKIKRMVSLIRSFEYIVTDSELEALILECNLIKNTGRNTIPCSRMTRAIPISRSPQRKIFQESCW